jgi:hypothetical protein
MDRPEPAPFARALLDPREPFLVPLVLMLAAHVAFWVVFHFAGEDAYITFRYARNLVTGHGLTFNPGVRVMGFTSPVWTLWNALGYLLTHDCVAWSRVTTFFGNAVTLAVVADQLRRRSRASAWVFAFLFAAWTYFPSVSASGMETAVLVTLMVVSAALVSKRHAAAGPALALLALFRPEGLIAAAVLALGATWRERAVALAIVAFGYGALASYFGSIIPQSVTAKAQIYGTPGLWAGRHWWEWAIPFSLGRWPKTSEGQFLYLMTVVAAPAALLGLAALWRRRDDPLARFAAAGLVVWAAYSITGAAYFFWYLAVPLATFFLAVAEGLPGMVRGRALYVSGVLFVLGTWSVVFTFYAGRAHGELSFAEIAKVLVARCEPGERILIEPIGVVGWFCPLQVIDESGLVSPAVARRRLTREPGWYTDVARATHPDWLVVRRGVLTSGQSFAGAGVPFRSTAERDSLFAGYQLIGWVDESSADNAFGVFQRRR